MSTDSSKKLTRYTSAVTVVTAEVMNSLFGGEYGHVHTLGEFHPLVAGHVHDGDHADGHASKISLTSGEHVRGYLSHGNLGGTDGSTPAVQKVNIQSYSEDIHGPDAKTHAIPVYEEDEHGVKHYYLDLSNAAGGVDTHIQYNEEGELSGSEDLAYNYTQKIVNIGRDSGASLHVHKNSGMASPHLLLVEDAGDGHGSRISFVNKSDDKGPQLLSHEWTIYAKSAAEDNGGSAEFNIWYGDANGGGNGANIISVSGNKLVGINKSPTVELDVDGSGSFTGDLNIDGKLTVAGLIDPTGLVLTEEDHTNIPTGTGYGAFFVAKDDPSLDNNMPYYKDAEGNISSLRGALPGGANGSIQYNDNGELGGSTSLVIKGDSLGVGTDTAEGPQRKLHVEGDGSVPPFRLGGIPLGSGNELVIDPATGDVYSRLYSPINPKFLTWPAGSGDIVLDSTINGNLVILSGEWNGSGRVVIPSVPGPSGANWKTGDNFWIKNLTTYTQGSSGSGYHTDDSGYHTASHTGNHTASSGVICPQVDIIADNPVDTLDLAKFDSTSPCYLPGKNAKQFCCSKGPSGENNWILVSHYHDYIHAEQNIPVAEIKVYVPYGGPNGEDSELSNGDSVNPVNHSYLRFDGQLSYDPDGSPITKYNWSVSIDGGTPTESSYPTVSFDTYSFTNSVVEVTLVVESGGESSLPANFSFRVVKPNAAPRASISGPTLVGDGATVTLHGRASSDEDGDALSYSWNLENFPEGSSASIDMNQISSDTITFTTDLPGSYDFSLDVSDGELTARATHSVVMDAKPEIFITGQDNVIINEGTSYSDAGATASDNEDGDITSSIVTTNLVDTNSGGTYTVKYNVKDSFNQFADEVTRTVVVNSKPVINLIGQNPVSVSFNSTYSDAGAQVTDSEDGSITITSESTPIDTSSVGSYTLKYNYTDSNGLAADEITRTVNVVSNKPIISLNGDSSVTINLGSTYSDQGATATDDEDGNITDRIVTVNNVDSSTAGTYSVTYNVEDLSGLAADEVVRSVKVNAKPVISLNGQSTVTITEGDIYSDEGATAADDEDGNITGSIVTSNNVNSNSPGSYTVTYDVDDSNGFAADQVVRTVIVEQGNQEPVARIIDPGQLTVGSEVSLDGSSSSDPDGDALSYSWTVRSAPNQSSLSTSEFSTSSIATFTPDEAGSYDIALQVSDGRGGVNTAVITLEAAVAAGSVTISIGEIGDLYMATYRDYTIEHSGDIDGVGDRKATVSIDDPDGQENGNIMFNSGPPVISSASLPSVAVNGKFDTRVGEWGLSNGYGYDDGIWARVVEMPSLNNSSSYPSVQYGFTSYNFDEDNLEISDRRSINGRRFISDEDENARTYNNQRKWFRERAEQNPYLVKYEARLVSYPDGFSPESNSIIDSVSQNQMMRFRPTSSTYNGISFLGSETTAGSILYWHHNGGIQTTGPAGDPVPVDGGWFDRPESDHWDPGELVFARYPVKYDDSVNVGFNLFYGTYIWEISAIDNFGNETTRRFILEIVNTTKANANPNPPTGSNDPVIGTIYSP